MDPRSSLSSKKVNIRKSPRHILIKFIKTMMKRKILKVTEKKRQITEGKRKRITTYFSPETMQTRK